MLVGFTITRAISAYQYLCWEFEPHSRRGVFDTTLCDKVCQWLPMNTWVHPRGLVGFVLLILLVFCIVLFVLSSSRVLCVQCCQCLWFAPSVFSNIYRNLVLINVTIHLHKLDTYFNSDLRQTSGFFRGAPFSTTNETDRHDITEIWLQVALYPNPLILLTYM